MTGYVTTNKVTVFFDIDPTEDGQWQVVEYQDDWSPRISWKVPTKEMANQIVKERKTQWKRIVNKVIKEWKESPKWEKYQQEQH